MKLAIDSRKQFAAPVFESWREDKMGHLSVSAQIGFRNILFATDFSFATGLAVPYVVEVARRSGGTIHVMHVIPTANCPLAPPSESPKTAQEEKEFCEEKKNELEQKLAGLPHEFLFLAGDVWENMASVIEDKDIDLLILGTHGRAEMGNALVGPVVEKIFSQAVCPILTVGPAVSSKISRASGAELNRIVYATDFSPESLAAAPYAVWLAEEHRAELILLHSIHMGEPGQMGTGYQTLRDVVPANANLEFKARLIVEPGTPETTILGVAARYDADLIILGVRSAKEHAKVMGRPYHSIAYQILSGADCPVLTVRG